MQSEGLLPSFFTFLIQLSSGFQILHKFSFVISIHSMNKVFEEKMTQSISLKNRNQKTSTNLSSSVTAFTNYGMN